MLPLARCSHLHAHERATSTGRIMDSDAQRVSGHARRCQGLGPGVLTPPLVCPGHPRSLIAGFWCPGTRRTRGQAGLPQEFCSPAIDRVESGPSVAEFAHDLGICSSRSTSGEARIGSTGAHPQAWPVMRPMDPRTCACGSSVRASLVGRRARDARQPGRCPLWRAGRPSVQSIHGPASGPRRPVGPQRTLDDLRTGR